METSRPSGSSPPCPLRDRIPLSTGAARFGRRKPGTPVAWPAAPPFLPLRGTSGGAYLKKPTKGRERDYDQLAAKALELAEAQGVTINAASMAVAKEVAPHQVDSVARGIRRHLSPKALATPRSNIARVGLGVIHRLIFDRLKLLENECLRLHQTEEQYARAARRADLIVALLEGRLAELESLRPEDATAAVRELLGGLAEADPEVMDPAAIAAREIADLKHILDKARRLQDLIDVSRPEGIFRDLWK